VDGRVKPGHDSGGSEASSRPTASAIGATKDDWRGRCWLMNSGHAGGAWGTWRRHGPPDHSPGAAKTVKLPRRTQGSFTRCFCSPNPSASTAAASIQMRYEPFCSGSKVQELQAMTGSRPRYSSDRDLRRGRGGRRTNPKRAGPAIFENLAIVGLGHIDGCRRADRLGLAPPSSIVGLSRHGRRRRCASSGASDLSRQW
jgi:hypothetical protein